MNRQDALVEIADIAKRHNLTAQDILAAMTDTPETKAQKSGGIIGKLFGYIGGILVFAGLCIFIGMQWDHLGAASRIILTLGSGFCAYLMGLAAVSDPRYERAGTPLFLVSMFLQPGGIFVVMDEFSRGGDPAHGFLFMNFVMLVQQACTLIARQRTIHVLGTVVFAFCFFGTAFDLLDVPDRLNGLVMSSSLIFTGWAIHKSRHAVLAPITFFLGSLGFLCVSYDLLDNKPYEILFLGLACFFIYLATIARSRTLLLVGTLATIGYIGEFTHKFFPNESDWPIMLMLMGLILLGLGGFAMKLNNKYIKQQ